MRFKSIEKRIHSELLYKKMWFSIKYPLKSEYLVIAAVILNIYIIGKLTDVLNQYKGNMCVCL